MIVDRLCMRESEEHSITRHQDDTKVIRKERGTRRKTQNSSTVERERKDHHQVVIVHMKESFVPL
jgi:hypothetical protein